MMQSSFLVYSIGLHVWMSLIMQLTVNIHNYHNCTVAAHWHRNTPLITAVC